MIPRTFETPGAFKQSLESRLRATSHDGTTLMRRRQLLVFDRFLARVVQVFGDAVTLKGGLVLELRLDRARTTKDIDLRFVGSVDGLLAQLQAAGQQDLGDFMVFEVQPDAHMPHIQNDGMKYDGLRFRAECKLAGKLYGQVFGVDVAVGDPVYGQPDAVAADDVLAFAGIAPPVVRLYPIETHIAEKLHAYTMPRATPNTRVKDLPDIALLATACALDSQRLRAALEQTFGYRATHDLPASMPAPSPAWEKPYAAIAAMDELPWRTLDEVAAAARAFLDPVLAGSNPADWRQETWTWRSRDGGPP